jgi:hypothetical protein
MAGEFFNMKQQSKAASQGKTDSRWEEQDWRRTVGAFSRMKANAAAPDNRRGNGSRSPAQVPAAAGLGAFPAPSPGFQKWANSLVQKGLEAQKGNAEKREAALPSYLNPSVQNMTQLDLEEDPDFFLNYNDEFGENRFWKTVSGAAKSYAGGLLNLGRDAAAAQSKNWEDFTQREVETWNRYIDAWEKRLAQGEKDGTLTKEEETWLKELIQTNQENISVSNLAQKTRKNAAKETEKWADSMLEEGQKDLASAKKGLGSVGSFGVDVLSALGQYGADVGLGLVTGGSALVPMTIRGYGAGSQQARRGGASEEEAVVFGMASAGLEVFLEKIGNLGLNKKFFGGGALDDVLQGMVHSLEKKGKTAAGRAALNRLGTAATSFVSEGFEEFLSGIGSPLLERLIYSKEPIRIGEMLGDALYDFAVGGAVGSMVGGAFGSERAALPATSPSEAPQLFPSAPSAEEVSETKAGLGGQSPVRQPGLPSIQQQLQRREQVEEAAAGSQALGPVGKAAAPALYDGTMEPESYYQGYMQSYFAGRNNQRRTPPWPLTGEQYKQAFRAGTLDAKEGKRSGGLIYNQAARKLQDAQTIHRMAKRLGVSVVVDESIPGPDGKPGGTNGYLAGDVIHIALDAQDPAMVVFKHEVTHLFKNRFAKDYRAFRDYAVHVMGEDAVNQILRDYSNPEARESLTQGGKQTVREGAMDEVAANFTEKLFTDPETVRRFIQEDRNLAQKIFDIIRDMVRKLTGTEKARLSEAEQLWANMFEEVAGQTNAAAQTDGDTRLSMESVGEEALNHSKSFSDERGAENQETAENVPNAVPDKKSSTGVSSFEKAGSQPRFSLKRVQNLTEKEVWDLLEDASNGVYEDRTYLPLRRNTPAILIERVAADSKGTVVVDNLPMVMQVAKIRQAMGEDTGRGKNRNHGISVNGMLELIKAMDDPTYILLQKNGRYVEVVRWYERGRHTAWAVLDFGSFHHEPFMNGYEGGSFNVLVTTFEPDDLQRYMQNHIEKIIYEKAKDAWGGSTGKSMPSVSSQTPFAENTP